MQMSEDVHTCQIWIQPVMELVRCWQGQVVGCLGEVSGKVKGWIFVAAVFTGILSPFSQPNIIPALHQ